MTQTPQQQRANKKYAQAAKNRKAQPATKQKQPNSKAPISTGWIVILAFVVCGGLLFELLRVVPQLWTVVSSAFSR